jgi:hypothetical protein
VCDTARASGCLKANNLRVPGTPLYNKGQEKMASFSDDVDILRYEPALFGELYPAAQVLIAGTGGALSGATFSGSGADFVSAQVSAGGVVYLQSEDGALDGAYERVSVDAAAQLTVSVIRPDSDDDAVPPPAATDISYRISTFGSQASEVGFQLMEYFGLRPGHPTSDVDVEDILDTDVLRRASVFAVISGVYATLASKAEDENFWKKSSYYQRLFEKARERCRLSIDVDNDGVADVTRLGASGRLLRD